MAIARRGTPTTLAQTASATSGAISVPTGVVDGDGLVLVVWMLGSNTLTVTSGLTGWTLKKTVTASTVVSGHIFTRVAASEPASYTMGYASCRVIAAMAAYSGTDQTDFVVAVDGQSGGTTVHTTPSVSSLNVDDWAFACFADRITSSASKNTGWTPGAGISTLLASLLSNNAAGTSPWGSMDVCDSNGAVSVGAHSYTDTSTTNTGNAMAGLVIIKAATTSTPISVSDTGSSAENAAVAAGSQLADAGSSDASLSLTANLALADSAASDATVSVAATVSLADAGAAAEGFAAGIPKTAADAGSSTEAATAAATTPTADAASATASLGAAASAAPQDAASASAALAVLAQLALAEAGSAVGGLAVSIAIGLTDVGSALDALAASAAAAGLPGSMTPGSTSAGQSTSTASGLHLGGAAAGTLTPASRTATMTTGG